MLGLRDQSLDFERQKADLNDKILELENQIYEAQRNIESLRADKDQAIKRGDDFKRKGEKTQNELDIRTHELEDAMMEIRRVLFGDAGFRAAADRELERGKYTPAAASAIQVLVDLYAGPGSRYLNFYGPARAGPDHARSTRSMTTGAITISIVNGTATDESLATRPTVPSTASPAAAARLASANRVAAE